MFGPPKSMGFDQEHYPFLPAIVGLHLQGQSFAMGEWRRQGREERERGQRKRVCGYREKPKDRDWARKYL